MVLLVAGGGEATPEAMVIPGTTDVAVSFSWNEDETSTLSLIIVSSMSSSEEMATSMTSVLFVAFESNSSAAFIVVDIALFPTLRVELRGKRQKFQRTFLSAVLFFSCGFVNIKYVCMQLFHPISDLARFSKETFRNCEKEKEKWLRMWVCGVFMM
jgi:hypothetical protein